MAVADIDLLVVPGLAFNRHGHRLGQGGGFYDRLLSSDEWGGVSCGVAYACQVVPTIPVQAHDRSVDLVVTDHAVARDGAWSSYPG